MAVSEFVAVQSGGPEATVEGENLQLPEFESSGFTPIPKKRPNGITPWSTSMGPKNLAPDPLEAQTEPDFPKLKLGIKAATPQSEHSLDSTPRGRFEGENPNVFDGEDLDLPPFLRRKK